MPIQRRHLIGASLAILGLSQTSAFAQAWPSRPVHLISPYGAGGASDILTKPDLPNLVEKADALVL